MNYNKPSFGKRNYEIVEHRVAGLTYRAIGEKFDLCGERIKQICYRAVRLGIVTAEEVNYKSVKSWRAWMRSLDNPEAGG